MILLSDVPLQSTSTTFLQSNNQAYEWLVKNIQALDAKNEGEKILRLIERAAWFAAYYHTGRFVDGAIENLAYSVGAKLTLNDSELKEICPPVVPIDGRRRVLHVTPMLAMGGHRQLLHHWIRNDPSSCHSLILIDEKDEVPSRFIEVVSNSGGVLVVVPQSISYCQKVKWLRKMAICNSDLVVWHLIGADVIPVAAFASQDCPPVVLIDHCDHIFWLGGSVADLVVNLRAPGAELALERRFISNTSVIPIPLLDPKIEKTRLEARQIVGIDEDHVMLLSIGRGEKYRPYRGYDFVATANKILERQPNVHLYVVGESVLEITPFLQCQIHERLHFMGSIDDPSVFRIAADVYIESFPFGSQTALLESALFGLPIVPAYSPLFPTLVANDDALIDILQNPINEQEFIERVEYLILNPVQRLQFGDSLRNRLLVDHIGSGWVVRLAELYKKAECLTHVPQLIPGSSCMLTDWDINLSQWHATDAKTPSPSIRIDDMRAGYFHKAFVSKTVGDFSTARKYAWFAVIRDPLIWGSWRLLIIAVMGKMSLFFRNLLNDA